ncbi:MAG TPA: hypothetical protein VMV40_06430 [Acidiferrobacter sp.]|nr:hypothetical protein [Acidiferrobacter sp.]
MLDRFLAVLAALKVALSLVQTILRTISTDHRPRGMVFAVASPAVQSYADAHGAIRHAMSSAIFRTFQEQEVKFGQQMMAHGAIIQRPVKEVT